MRKRDGKGLMVLLFVLLVYGLVGAVESCDADKRKPIKRPAPVYVAQYDAPILSDMMEGRKP